jgi:hypothetical protein
MPSNHFPPRVRWALGLGLTCLFLLGCGDGGGVRVRGQVMLDGKPLPAGVVVFCPDTTRGNASPHEARGAIQKDGTFEVSTNGKAGALPGWYKVTVIAIARGSAKRGVHPPPRSLIDRRYGSPATSGLEVEVARGKPAGAYDLALKGTGRR